MISIKNRQRLLLLLCLLSFALFLRIYNITKVPNSLYYDEVDLGYQARSIIETGKDYRGYTSPFFVLSFNDPRVPIPVYLTALSTMVFEKEELAVRMPGVILGTLSVLLVFLIINIWTKSFLAAFLAGVVFATNPWQLHNSRWGLEQIYSTTFLLGGLYLFFKALASKNYKLFLGSIIIFALSFYTYRTMGLLSPLVLIAMFIIYRGQILKFSLVKVLVSIILFLSLTVPFILATTVYAPDIPRINQISIFSDPLTPIMIQRNRELDSGDMIDSTPGKQAIGSSFLFHNKVLSNIINFFRNYISVFSLEFLISKGASNTRETVGEMGQLYFIDLIALIAGFFYIGVNRKKRELRLLIALLLLTPIPAAITRDGAGHGGRLFIVSVPLLIIVGLGWWNVAKYFSTNKKLLPIAIITILLWTSAFIFYLHKYHVHYPIISAFDYGYGFKETMKEIVQLSPNYERVYMVPNNDPPMIYYLFWSHTSPKELQQYGTKFTLGEDRQLALDKYKVVNWSITKDELPKMASLLEKDTLYMLTRRNFDTDFEKVTPKPEGVELLYAVNSPDNKGGFYLVAKSKDYEEKTSPY